MRFSLISIQIPGFHEQARHLNNSATQVSLAGVNAGAVTNSLHWKYQANSRSPPLLTTNASSNPVPQYQTLHRIIQPLYLPMQIQLLYHGCEIHA
mmetsp:Transcript_28898/g.35239  ORF Transcript_28898/g.35239 Transcript_28898/m.35239 type:complete len:95 (-) Transcript_28898:1396-1680(-)